MPEIDTNLIDKLTGKQDESTEVLSAQLAALTEQMKTLATAQEALTKENKALREFQDRTKRIIETPADKVDQGDLRAVMLAVGIPAEEVEKRLAGEEETPDPKATAKADPRLEELEKKVTSVATNVAQDRSKALRTHFDTKINAALDADKAFQTLYKAQVAAGKTKEAQALRDGAFRLLERSAMRELNEAASANKGVVDEATIDTVVPKVSGDLTTLTSAIEASSIAGRSPDTGVTEYQIRYPKDKPPVELPAYKGNEDIGTVEAGLESWLSDRLGREIAAHDSETAPSKV